MQTAVSGPSTLRISSTPTRPRGSLGSEITLKPHIAADAGFVPCAVSGTITLSRWVSPRSLKYFLAISSAPSSACAPADGLSENAAIPNSELSERSSSYITASAPCASSSGAYGCSSCELRARRDRVVDARVVLHRARAERIESEIDAERALRELRVVAHDVELAVVGQRQRRRAARTWAGTRRAACPPRNIGSRVRSWPSSKISGMQRSRVSDGGVLTQHLLRAAASASMSPLVVSSVAVISTQFASSG